MISVCAWAGAAVSVIRRLTEPTSLPELVVSLPTVVGASLGAFVGVGLEWLDWHDKKTRRVARERQT